MHLSVPFTLLIELDVGLVDVSLMILDLFMMIQILFVQFGNSIHIVIEFIVDLFVRLHHVQQNIFHVGLFHVSS